MLETFSVFLGQAEGATALFTETQLFWAYVVALGGGFYMAWSIGANDVANAMGTSVGSGALTLRNAIIVAAIFEFAGAFLVGSHVSDTVRKGILPLDQLEAMPGGANLYIYGIDEATGEQLENERTAFEAVHETGAKVFVACGRDSFELVGDLLDLAVYGGPPTPGEAGKWHSVGHRIFSYNHPQVGLEQPETYRRNFGLVLWQSGYDGTMNYAYQHASGDIYVDDDGPSFRDHVFAYPTVDGVIDTIQWEGFREGVDDVRYLTTLLKEIERAKADDGKAALAKEAEAWVATMDTGGDLQALRANMVEYILRLGN